jgi:glutamate decarboxylase
MGSPATTAYKRCSRDVAVSLAARIAELGPIRLLMTGHELPVFAFTLADMEQNY